jgi:hypothetical protein
MNFGKLKIALYFVWVQNCVKFFISFETSDKQTPSGSTLKKLCMLLSQGVGTFRMF